MNLTEIARKTLEEHFQGRSLELDKKTLKKYKLKKSCFVTLTINRTLRGCIGSLTPTKPLHQEVQENALNAAFRDPRFRPLEESELKKIKIEVSVLSPARKIKFKSPEDLLKKINNKMGIILKKNFYSSTFLPQVWAQIPNKVDFLEHLGLKAGLYKEAWKNAEIFYYNVKAEEER